MNQLNNFPFKRVLVLGLAKSGLATCHVLLRNGIDVIANDFKADANDPGLIELTTKGVQIIVEHTLYLY